MREVIRRTRTEAVRPQPKQDLVLCNENGKIVEKTVRAASMQLIRSNGGEIDHQGRITNKPATWKNETVVDEDGNPIPFSEGVICPKETGGSISGFESIGKVTRVLRTPKGTIVPGHITVLNSKAVRPCFGCNPDKMCPSSCANNRALQARSLNMTARSILSRHRS